MARHAVRARGPHGGGGGAVRCRGRSCSRRGRTCSARRGGPRTRAPAIASCIGTRLPFTLTAGAIGAVLLWFQSPRRPHRLGLLFYAAWMTPIVAGILLFAFGRALPVMRLVGVALPVVLLGAAAGVGLIKLAARTPGVAAWHPHAGRGGGGDRRARAPGRRGAQQLRGHAADGAPGGGGGHPHRDRVPHDRGARPQGGRRDRLAAGPGQRLRRDPVVPADQGVRPGLVRPPRGRRTWAIPANLLSGKETRRPDVPGYDATAGIYWALLEPWLTEDTVVMALAPFYDGYHALVKAHPDAEIAPGVMLLRGPSPPPGFAPPPPLSPPTAGALYRWIAPGVPGRRRRRVGVGVRAPAARVGGSAGVRAGARAGGAHDRRVPARLRARAREGPAGRWMFAGVVAGGWAVALARWGWTQPARPARIGADPRLALGRQECYV